MLNRSTLYLGAVHDTWAAAATAAAETMTQGCCCCRELASRYRRGKLPSLISSIIVLLITSWVWGGAKASHSLPMTASLVHTTLAKTSLTSFCNLLSKGLPTVISFDKVIHCQRIPRSERQWWPSWLKLAPWTSWMAEDNHDCSQRKTIVIVISTFIVSFYIYEVANGEITLLWEITRPRCKYMITDHFWSTWSNHTNR